MGDAARLGWYAVVEALTLLRWLVATVLSILGVARVDGVFAALRGNADRHRARPPRGGCAYRST